MYRECTHIVRSSPPISARALCTLVEGCVSTLCVHSLNSSLSPSRCLPLSPPYARSSNTVVQFNIARATYRAHDMSDSTSPSCFVRIPYRPFARCRICDRIYANPAESTTQTETNIQPKSKISRKLSRIYHANLTTCICFNNSQWDVSMSPRCRR